MRKTPFSAAILLASGFALSQAEAGLDTRTMTCEQLHSFVAERGAVVMDTGPHTYKRFVAHRGYCLVSERLETAWAPTLDGTECRLKECAEPMDYRRRRGSGTGK